MHSTGAPESMKRSITAFHQFFGTRKELTKNVLISGTKGDEWFEPHTSLCVTKAHNYIYKLHIYLEV